MISPERVPIMISGCSSSLISWMSKLVMAVDACCSSSQLENVLPSACNIDKFPTIVSFPLSSSCRKLCTTIMVGCPSMPSARYSTNKISPARVRTHRSSPSFSIRCRSRHGRPPGVHPERLHPDQPQSRSGDPRKYHSSNRQDFRPRQNQGQIRFQC